MADGCVVGSGLVSEGSAGCVERSGKRGNGARITSISVVVSSLLASKPTSRAPVLYIPGSSRWPKKICARASVAFGTECATQLELSFRFEERESQDRGEASNPAGIAEDGTRCREYIGPMNEGRTVW